ncbi:hypothetical protein ACLMAJ_32140 [Nocardia sp. KC 131]|uniref:hypothetical protein n=1 Tax=Nocardia arseniciresistens TaxID=3392119 RepID=UPI00398EB85F
MAWSTNPLATLVRCAVPPLTVQLATVTSRSWKTGLHAAGQFAPFCARTLHLPKTPDDITDAQMQASFYGMGLRVGLRDRYQELVAPTPYVRHRHAADHWHVAEMIYQQIQSSCAA